MEKRKEKVETMAGKAIFYVRDLLSVDVPLLSASNKVRFASMQRITLGSREKICLITF